MVVKFLLAEHNEQQWNSDPQYQSYGSSDDADIGQWAPEGSAAAAALYVMEKISSVECGSQVLQNMRLNEIVQQILGLINIAVVEHRRASPDSGADPQVNIHPDDFRNDDGEDEDEQVHRDEADDNLQHQYEKEHILLRLQGRSLNGLIRELILQILWRASAVFSTTHVGAGLLVKKFTKVANEYILDEAAAATIPEALQIWRNDRPFIMGGDPFQLLPSTLSAGARYYGTDRVVNPLAMQRKLSLLRLAMINGWPCLVLKYQRRMVCGLFNVSNDIFYHNWNLSYGTSCIIGEHPVAQRCEAWAMRKLDITQSPQGKVFPVFIHVPRSEVKYTEVSRLHSNAAMLDILIRTLNRLIQGAGLDLKHIAIITLYVLQATAILKAVGGRYISVSNVPNKILLTIADRAQGNERNIVVFLTVNTTASGAGFLWDENRINVISTRASDYFIVIGDIDVARKNPSENTRQSSARAFDKNKLPQWIQFFCCHGRVANRDGAQKATWLGGDQATFNPVKFQGSLAN